MAFSSCSGAGRLTPLAAEGPRSRPAAPVATRHVRQTGRQPGVPRRAARAIIAALDRHHPAAGARPMAYDMAIDQLESMLANQGKRDPHEISGLRRRPPLDDAGGAMREQQKAMNLGIRKSYFRIR